MQGVKILLGISGGIAAYKAADLASKLRQNGAIVKTIMTDNACKLITPKLIEAVSAGPVFTSMWNQPQDYRIGHIDLVEQSDLIVVAPATANIIAKMASGICDDLLSTTLCAGWQKKIILAPAMNTGMWTNPSTTRNVKLLREAGVEFIGPENGHLACGVNNIGRMSEPTKIIEKIKQLIV